MGAGELDFGCWHRASMMPVTNDNLAPSQPEGSGTFRMATWNIVDGRGGHMAQAAAGLAQMGIGLGGAGGDKTR